MCHMNYFVLLTPEWCMSIGWHITIVHIKTLAETLLEELGRISCLFYLLISSAIENWQSWKGIFCQPLACPEWNGTEKLRWRIHIPCQTNLDCGVVDWLINLCLVDVIIYKCKAKTNINLKLRQNFLSFCFYFWSH